MIKLREDVEYDLLFIDFWLHLMIKLREDVEYDLLFIDFLENILESTIILFENCIFCALKKEKNHNQEDVFQWSLRAKNKTKQTNKKTRTFCRHTEQ